MKSKIDISILESADIIKKGCSFIANNAGRVIALITFIIASLVIFTDVSFCDFSAKSFCTVMVLILIASYIIYFSLEDAGEKLGEESEEYIKAKESYLSILSDIGGEKIEPLRVFCKDYSLRELEYRRENLLISAGLTRAEYERYKSGEKCSKGDIRVFKRVEKQRAVTLTPSMLLTKERLNLKSELKNPESTKFFHLFLKLIPSTICMAVTVSVVLSAKESLTAVDVIDGLLKLSSLPIIGFRGYSQGYVYTKKNISAWLDTKTSLLTAFLKNEAA